MISNIQIPNSTIGFCANRNEREYMSDLIKAHQGQGVDQIQEQDLLEGNYIPALTLVWSERDRGKRLEWLRAHSGLHAPLLFERGMAEFATKPTTQTVEDVVMPLFRAARFRVDQDVQCVDDESAKQAGDCLLHIYGKAFKTLIETKKIVLTFCVTDSLNEKAQALFSRIIRTSLEEECPNPRWVGYHGLHAYLSGEPSMLSEGEWHEKRASFAEQELNKIIPPSPGVVYADRGKVSTRLCAIFCQTDKLRSADIPEGWESYPCEINSYDYYGVAFVNHQEKVAILAHRETGKDLAKDYLSALGSLSNGPLVSLVPEVYFEAARWSNTIRNRFAAEEYQFVETGYSLGGIYAKFNAYLFNSKSITYDSPGAADFLLRENFRWQLIERTAAKLGEEISAHMQRDGEVPIRREDFLSYLTVPTSVNTLGRQLDTNTFQIG